MSFPPAPFDRNAALDPVRFRRSMQLGRRDVATIAQVEAAASPEPSPLTWLVIPVTRSMFTAASTGETVTIWSIPPKYLVKFGIVRSVTPFAGPSLSSATLTLDTPATDDVRGSEFVPSIDVFSATDPGWAAGTANSRGLEWTTRSDAEVPLTVSLSLSGCNCNQLTDGEAEVVLLAGPFP